MTTTRHTILLVEDSVTDVRLTRLALGEADAAVALHVVRDGIEAGDFLRRRNTHEAVPRPDLVLLDLNLPRKDGRALLQEIKTDDDLRSIPVVVFTTSSSDEDVARCYALHANAYVTKPIGYGAFKAALDAVRAFWLTTASLP